MNDESKIPRSHRRLCEVIWRDAAYPEAREQSASELEKSAVGVWLRTSGYVLTDNEHGMRLSQEETPGDADSVRNVIEILRVNIKKVNTLYRGPVRKRRKQE